MTQLVKGSRLFPETRSLLSGFFDDEFFGLDFPRLGNGWRSDVPAANVKESENAFTIDLAVPGMSKKDFQIDVSNGVMTISSEKEEESEDKTDDYTRREFSYSSFSRSFRLPESVNEDKIKAQYDNGVLVVTLPKKDDAKAPATRKEIKVG